MTSIETQIAFLKSLNKKEIDKQRRSIINDAAKSLQDYKDSNASGHVETIIVSMSVKQWKAYTKTRQF
jgi:hypothetical protein